MKSIQRLLVPTDLSENSRRGLHYACSLAAENNGFNDLARRQRIGGLGDLYR